MMTVNLQEIVEAVLDRADVRARSRRKTCRTS